MKVRGWMVAAAMVVAFGTPGATRRAVALPVPSAIVAYTGQTAPGTGGATYFLLYQPTITRDGDVLFRSEIAGAGTNSTNNRAYWRLSGGSPVALLLRAGTPSPVPGFNWSGAPGEPTSQEVAGDARAGFCWSVVAGGSPVTSLWSEQAGSFRRVAFGGGPVPGVAGATFPAISISEVNFDEAGDLLFAEGIAGPGINTTNDTGLWLDNGTATTLVVREGDPVPGYPAGTFFPGALGNYAQLSPGGLVHFYASVSVPSVGFRTGIWSNRGGALAPAVLDGQPAPGVAGRNFSGPTEPYTNRHGQLAFLSGLSGGSAGWGIWITDSGGSPSLAYLQQNTNPEILVNASIRRYLADNGVFYLMGQRVLPGGGVRTAIFGIGTSGWKEVAFSGQRAADLPAGIIYNQIDQYTVNDKGQVAFRATISGPGVTSANNYVLVQQGGDGLFHLVARTGESLEVTPGDVRTISGLSITQNLGTGSGTPGVLRSFSDTGSLVWYASTVGGFSAAILVTNLGVPPAVQLVGLEAVQVVQDWNGSVPLVAGKTTYVRAHLQSATRTKVTPVLRARVGGVELPYSPLVADDPEGSASVPGIAAQRGNLFDSIEWRLPPAWTQGTVQLEVDLLDRNLDCLEAAGPTTHDCKTTATFEPVPIPDIKFVAVDYTRNGDLQRVSEAQRSELVPRLISAVPVRDVDVQFGRTALSGAAPPDPNACAVKNEMEVFRLADGCRNEDGCRRLYYGILLGNKESGCAAVGKAWAAGYFPLDELAKGRHNHTHEVAHLLGINHTVDPTLQPLPQGRLPGFCGEDAPPGPASPPFLTIEVVNGNRRPVFGPLGAGEDAKVFGFDSSQVRAIAPTSWFDLMSYCSVGGIDLWPAKWTYERLKDAIEFRFAGNPTLAAPAAPEGATVLLVKGAIETAAGTAQFDPFVAVAAGALAPAPDPGPYTLRIHRSGGGTEDLSFAPEQEEGHGTHPTASPFLFEVSSPATVTGVEIRQGATPLAVRNASASAPVVQVVSPNGGELLDQPTVDIVWSASDADADPLTFLVQWSADGGATWTTLATRQTGTSLTVDRSELAGTVSARFRVQASDGLRTATDESNGSAIVEGHPPLAAILLPESGQLFYDGQALMLQATALDPEDGQLSGPALSWSSNLAGALGTGSPLTIPVNTLPGGHHLVTLSAEDSDGNVSSAAVWIWIDSPALIFEDGFEIGGTSRWL